MFDYTVIKNNFVRLILNKNEFSVK